MANEMETLELGTLPSCFGMDDFDNRPPREQIADPHRGPLHGCKKRIPFSSNRRKHSRRI